MSLERIAKSVGIDWTKTEIHIGKTVLDFEFEITPADFLRFAHQDFNSGDKKGLVNGLTNAKRAIDCQIDKFFACIGYEPNTELPQNAKEYIKRRIIPNSRADFSQKLRLLYALDVAPLGLISKIRGLRNLLEHEYKLPSENEVTEGLEIATLFIGAVNNVLNSFVNELVIGNLSNMYREDGRFANVIYVFYKQENASFEIRGIADKNYRENFEISKTHHQYLELLRLNIAVISTNGYIESALYDFLQTINCSIPEQKIRVNVALG